MRKQILMMAVVGAIVMFHPMAAQAQTFCISIGFGGEILKLRVEGSATVGAETHLNLLGEHLGTCGAGTSRPLNGNLEVEAPSTALKLHLGTISHNSSAACVPVFIQGTLNGGLVGTGFFRNLAGGSAALAFAPVACPPSPDAVVGGAVGTTTGTIQ